MGKGLKIVCVGLPMFTERLVNGLKEFDSSNKYIRLDTYYNKKDQLKALFHIPRADCLFSINGTIRSSRAFDLAFKKKVPVIMNWVGTDVLKSIDAFEKGDFNQSYIDDAIHLCEVDWIQEELKTIGIHAEISNFACFEKRFEKVERKEGPLTVLSYISENRSEFYGMNEFLNLAQKFPDVNFEIAGTEAKSYEPLPENLNALGWVKDMDTVFQRADVCVRYTEHDGLSTFILEALARGKQVIYKNKYTHCEHAPDESCLEERLKVINTKFKSGASLDNQEGRTFVENAFCQETIYGDLIKRIKEIVGK